jgi:hypothetical protein
MHPLRVQSQGLAHDFKHLFLSRMFLGLGECLNAPTSYAIIASYFPLEQVGGME